MISENYTRDDQLALRDLGYEACFMDDLVDGDEIAFKEHITNYEDNTSEIRITFVTVSRLRKYPTYDTNPETFETIILNQIMKFVAISPEGLTKPMSYGGSWGCYRKVKS